MDTAYVIWWSEMKRNMEIAHQTTFGQKSINNKNMKVTKIGRDQRMFWPLRVFSTRTFHYLFSSSILVCLLCDISIALMGMTAIKLTTSDTSVASRVPKQTNKDWKLYVLYQNHYCKKEYMICIVSNVRTSICCYCFPQNLKLELMCVRSRTHITLLFPFRLYSIPHCSSIRRVYCFVHVA